MTKAQQIANNKAWVGVDTGKEKYTHLQTDANGCWLVEYHA